MSADEDSNSRYCAVSPNLIEEWNTIQNDLKQHIICGDTELWQLSEDLSGLRRVAGIDISTPADAHDAPECDAFAAVVICEFPSMEMVHQEVQLIHLTVPYVPGYLAFRETEPVVKILEKIIKEHPDKVPDVLLVDGNGILHPHRCGLACHIGLKTSIPTIGVAKNLHLIDGIDVTKSELQNMTAVGDHILLKGDSKEIIGMALKTAQNAKRPMYLSVGHKISLDTAKRVVLKCCKYRIPDPIRFADNISREQIRKTEENHRPVKNP